MRTLNTLLGVGLITCLGLSTSLLAQQSATTYQSPTVSQTPSSFRVGIVNTKRCLEDSKLGKHEQANVEKMKKQMESVLQEKEKALEEVETKLNDEDYMDSVSEEAAAEITRKRGKIRKEGMQLQSQYMQVLQQTNFKIIQKLSEAINKGTEQVAQEATYGGQPFDFVINDEATTYFNPQLDITDQVIAKMNSQFDIENKDNQSKNR